LSDYQYILLNWTDSPVTTYFLSSTVTGKWVNWNTLGLCRAPLW